MWGVGCSAQKLVHHIDSVLTVRKSVENFDTAYIRKPKEDWTFSARLNGSQWEIVTDHKESHTKNTFNSYLKRTVSLTAAYKGVSLSLSIDPARMFGRSSDIELSHATYGRRFGFEAQYHWSGKFDAKTKTIEQTYNTSDYINHIAVFNFRGYYAFNARKFAYGAAFTQNLIQRRSAGSLLLGVSAMYVDGHVNEIPHVGMHETEVNMLMFGVGVGYGYNFVLPKNWLIHVSAIPTVVVAQHNTISYAGESARMKYALPELMNTGRVSVCHNFRNFFVGASSNLHFNMIGERHNLTIHNSRWNARVFVGMRM